MKFAALFFIAFALYASSAQAYVGPGIGLGAIGAIVGIVLSVLMAIVGIFWYPIKRMFKKGDDEESIEADDTNQVQEEDNQSATQEADKKE